MVCDIGVSMSLFGVITRVSFRLLQMRLVEGSESDHNLAESMLGLDKDGNSKLKESLEKNENMGVDPYWWAYNKGDKRTFFSYLWDILLDIPGTRLLWGKNLPLPGQVCGHTTINLAYLKRLADKILARHPRNTNSTHL